MYIYIYIYICLYICVCVCIHIIYESLSQSSIETIHERRNGIKSLLVCLSEYLHLFSPTMPASCVLIGITHKYKILPLNISKFLNLEKYIH